jgi:hypothetical protein
MRGMRGAVHTLRLNSLCDPLNFNALRGVFFRPVFGVGSGRVGSLSIGSGRVGELGIRCGRRSPRGGRVCIPSGSALRPAPGKKRATRRSPKVWRYTLLRRSSRQTFYSWVDFCGCEAASFIRDTSPTSRCYSTRLPELDVVYL